MFFLLLFWAFKLRLKVHWKKRVFWIKSSYLYMLFCKSYFICIMTFEAVFDIILSFYGMRETKIFSSNHQVCLHLLLTEGIFKNGFLGFFLLDCCCISIERGKKKSNQNHEQLNLLQPLSSPQEATFFVNLSSLNSCKVSPSTNSQYESSFFTKTGRLKKN